VHFRGGESVSDVLERWRGFARQLTGNDEAVVVTHDVVVRLAILDATGRGPARLWEPRVVNAGFAVFSGGTPWRLVDECEDDHLRGIDTDPASQAL
jgi:broad specificity phosphatase PhoE